MADSRISFSDEMLGAHADDELDPDMAAEVERRAAIDPLVRRRLGAIRRVTQLVRDSRSASGVRAAPIADEPVAERAAGISARRPRWVDWRIAASFVAGALVLGSLLELSGGPGGEVVDWRQNALAFHDRYLRARENGPADAMPEILANEPDDLARSISFAPSVPDLASHGYDAVGAELLTAPHGPILYVMFEGAQRRPIGFVMTRSPGGAVSGNATVPLVHANADGVTLVSWSAGSFEYGLSGRVSPMELMPLVETVRNALPAELH